jgi:Immunoglobulin domain/Immunoglobulin I-set domain
MKKILTMLALAAMTTASVHAQGYVFFNNNNVSKTSTNVVVGGGATGSTLGAGQYVYALFYSTNATSVNGQTAPIVGTANNNYAFTDSAWKFAGYATNTASAGRLTAVNTTVNGLVITDVPGGNSARFVVIGWSANIGSTIGAVASWYNSGNPVSNGLIGQSIVSGALTLGDGASLPTPQSFGSIAPPIQGFILGQVNGFLTYNPATITSQPMNQTIALGGTAIFQAVAYGDAALAFSHQWRLNGTNIFPGGNYSMSVTNFAPHIAGFTLTVTSAQLSHAGNFSIYVANSAGSAISSNALLTIGGLPPVITSQPTNVNTFAGANVAFGVAATGSAPFSYQWSYHGTNLANATNATLPLVNVTPASAGNYSVSIANAFGATNSVVALLMVQPGVPPVITAQPLPQSVQIGSTANFSVSVNASAPLSYQWLFNGSNLAGATNNLLTLVNVQTNQAGSYSVAISNPYGATNSFAAPLTVFQPSGYVLFAGGVSSSTKIFTNSAVGGAATGQTGTTGGKYLYALFASATATSVNGQTTPILGGANNNYAFNDANWTLVAYGTNRSLAGRLGSISPNSSGLTPVAGFIGGTTAQFVVVGWSSEIGLNITAAQTWFNNGAVATDGWLGQSAVSGAMVLGDDGLIPAPNIFGTAPRIPGFTLGLISPVPQQSYSVPYLPPAILTATRSGNSLQLSWPLAAGSFIVQSASQPAGPWTDLNLTIGNDGSNATATVNISGQLKFFRLIVQ